MWWTDQSHDRSNQGHEWSQVPKVSNSSFKYMYTINLLQYTLKSIYFLTYLQNLNKTKKIIIYKKRKNINFIEKFSRRVRS